MSVGLFARVLLLAGTAVVGSVWALVHYYAHPRAPMLVPAPSGPDASDWPADGGLIVAPEIELAPR